MTTTICDGRSSRMFSVATAVADRLVETKLIDADYVTILPYHDVLRVAANLADNLAET